LKGEKVEGYLQNFSTFNLLALQLFFQIPKGSSFENDEPASVKMSDRVSKSLT
jgi:hypothetical protein